MAVRKNTLRAAPSEEVQRVESADVGDDAVDDAGAAPRVPVEEIRRAYAFVIDRLELTDGHRRELKSKRGFDDTTIRTLGFRSAGKAARPILGEMCGEFTEEVLIASGLFERAKVVGGDSPATTLKPSGLVASAGILIPYVNDAGECIYVRRHKFGPKDVRLELYTPHLGKPNDARTLYITEAEFKAAALAQEGFWAIGVPGVASFVGEHFERLVAWIRAHRTPSVVVVFDTEHKADPDAPNYKPDFAVRYDTPYYAWRLAHQLEQANVDATIATLPLGWDEDGLKVDCDSALASGKTAKEFEAVFAKAVRPSDYLRADPSITHLTVEAHQVLPLKMADLLLGDAYDVKPSGIVHHKQSHRGKDSKLTTGTVPEHVAHAPVWIVGSSQSAEDRQRYVELGFTYPKDGQPRLETALVKRGAAFDRRKLIEYANDGLPVDSERAGRLVSYLSELESKIAPYLPTDRLTERGGWHEIEGVQQFVLGHECLVAPSGGTAICKARLHLSNEGGLRQIADALQPHGTLEAWRAVADKARSASPLARFALAVGFASPLSRLLDVRPALFHIYGESETGKTAIETIVASIWGQPRGLISTHNATPASIEYKAAFLCDLPTLLDELQLQRNPDLRELLIYMFAQGTGKTRAKRDGGLRDTPRWYGVCLSTGEEPITTDGDLGGQSARVVELRVRHGEPILDKALAQQAYQLRAYGLAGRRFVQQLLDIDPVYLREQHEQLRKSLAEGLDSLRASTISALAVVALADALVSERIFDEDAGDETSFGHESLELVRELYKDQPPSMTYADRAYEDIQSWIDAHRAHFNELPEGSDPAFDDTAATPRYGWLFEDGSAWLIPTEFEKALTQLGYAIRRAIEDLEEAGHIETQTTHGSDGKSKKRRRVRRSVDGKQVTLYVLRRRVTVS